MAFTTILGMIPLLRDAFFKDVAIAIMAGLAFATILALIIVPVLHAIFFRIREPEDRDRAAPTAVRWAA